jgi:hypothetical protein
MPKPVPLGGADLKPAAVRSKEAAIQRGSTPSAGYLPLQFRMPPSFVRRFKQTALDRGLKLNELLTECFELLINTKTIR